MFIHVNIICEEYHIFAILMNFWKTKQVFVMVLPRNSIWGPTDSRSHVALASLVVLATCVGMVGCFFILVLTKGVSNEIQLRAALFQQLEATKEAESKNSHKSIVFASMSHDLRTPLAAILGLIDLCLCDATESSELESNLFHMKSCATNLLGALSVCFIQHQASLQCEGGMHALVIHATSVNLYANLGCC
jgi:signal transduction histidine kinase